MLAKRNRNFKDKIEMRLNTIPSAVVSANTGGVPVGREDDAATADVVVAKLKQPLSPAEKKMEIPSSRFFSGFYFWFEI